jgi:hypothetical protein
MYKFQESTDATGGMGRRLIPVVMPRATVRVFTSHSTRARGRLSSTPR